MPGALLSIFGLACFTAAYLHGREPTLLGVYGRALRRFFTVFLAKLVFLLGVIALSVVYTPRTARIVRSTVLVVREMEYVQAARACGASRSGRRTRSRSPHGSGAPRRSYGSSNAAVVAM